MKVLVVEDEIHNFLSMCKMLEEIDPNIQIVGPVTEVAQLSQQLAHQEDYDLILSDIRLDDGVCFEAYAETEPHVPIIFTTAYDEYALRAFESNGIAYLLKPIEKSKLENALAKVKRMSTKAAPDLTDVFSSYGMPQQKKYQTRFLIDKLDATSILDVEDVNHFTMEDEKVVAWLNDGTSRRLSLESLDAVESRVDPALFFRANRQYIISLHAIDRIISWFRQKKKVILKHYPDIEISISKEKVQKFRSWIAEN